MNRTEFERVAETFADFHREFAPLFGRPEAVDHAEQYVRGLLVQQTDRRNAENVSEAVGNVVPRTLQRFLTNSPWSTERVIDRLQRCVGRRLTTPDGIFVADGSEFPKQGKKSVGVARQYCGRLGKVANCQAGVFLTYVSERGHALVDARLYLLRGWTEDPERRQAAGVPETVSYQSKAELALASLRQARQAGHLTGRWVTADEDYGKVPTFRDALDAESWWYVLEVPCATRVFTRSVKTEVPQWSGKGPKPSQLRLVDGEPGPQSVEEVAQGVARADWRVLTVAEGAQGPRNYEFAAQRVWESREDLPGRECWLVLRRNLDGSELKYYLSNAPADTLLSQLAHVGSMRWCIETDLQTSKGEAGLDEYEVRSWKGWHHHMVLAMLAAAFLLTLRLEWGEKDAPDHVATGQPSAACFAPAAGLDPR
jgi:SRSO17 transposase